MQNKLFYSWKTQFNYVNEIEPLVEILHPLVFTGEEVMEQPLVNHYATDKDGCLTVGDGTERQLCFVIHFTFDIVIKKTHIIFCNLF